MSLCAPFGFFSFKFQQEVVNPAPLTYILVRRNSQPVAENVDIKNHMTLNEEGPAHFNVDILCLW